MPIRGVLFDKDGTLLDYHLTWGPINVAAADIAAAGDRALADRLLAVGGMDRASMITRAGSLLAAAHTVEIATAWVEAGSPLQLEDLAGRARRPVHRLRDRFGADRQSRRLFLNIARRGSDTRHRLLG